MNNMLMESNSPTQQRDTSIQNTKSINVEIMDDNEEIFPVEITYDYYDYPGWDKWEISVMGFDYKVNGTPIMSAKDLCECIKDAIREEEDYTVTFY